MIFSNLPSFVNELKINDEEDNDYDDYDLDDDEEGAGNNPAPDNEG